MFLILILVAVVAYFTYQSLPYSRSRTILTIGAAMIAFLVAPIVVDQISYLGGNMMTDTPAEG